MTNSADAVEQYTATGPTLGLGPISLIPPGSEDFEVHGNAETSARARQWAFDQQVLLFDGPARSCVHGLYRMDSCQFSACRRVGFDHTRIWVQADGRGAFLLTHPYVDEVPQAMRVYAEMHGLALDSFTFDRWYSKATLPIRLTIPTAWPLWPIERDAALLLHTQPIQWPAES